MENKVIQKKPKSRSISALQPTKGGKQKPRRYEFKLPPLPEKYMKTPKMYHLYADVILMECQDTLCLEASMYNYYKVYKHIEIDKFPYQRVVRVHCEDKDNQLDDWKKVVDELRTSPKEKLRLWADMVKSYCERYEEVMKEFQGEMSAERIAELKAINAQTQKLRKTFVNTFPVVEYRSELRDGQMQLVEVSYSEKYTLEIGYTAEEFIQTAFQEGLPTFLPLSAAGSSWIAKMRLDKFLTIDANGYQTPDSEHYVVMKDGSLRVVKFITHYYTTFENGVPGFVFFGVMTARPRLCTGDITAVEKRRVSKDFANTSFEKEDRTVDFLDLYYGDRAENR